MLTVSSQLCPAVLMSESSLSSLPSSIKAACHSCDLVSAENILGKFSGVASRHILVRPSACALLEDQPMNCGRAVVRPAIWDKRKPRKTRYAMINVWPKTSYFTRTESSTGWNKKLAISFNTLAGGVRDQAVDLVTLLLLQNSHNNGLRWI